MNPSLNHGRHASTSIDQLRLAVVTPMANERDSAVPFVAEVLERASVFRSVTHIVVFDQMCRDGTYDVLREYAGNEPRLEVVWAPENRSVVDAYVRGYRAALATGSEWILEIDAGFSHQPRDLVGFLPYVEAGYDCIFGTRFGMGGSAEGVPLSRRIVSRGGTVLANALLGTRLTDMTSGFQMFERHALDTIVSRGIQSKGHFFQTEMKAYCRKMKVAEVPIHYRSPSNSITGSVVRDAFGQLWRLFRDRLRGRL